MPITLLQIGGVNAQTTTGNKPVVTSPITSPITSFTSTIRGQIKYRFLNPLPKINSVYIIPARNVVVKAGTEKTSGGKIVQTISTKTDANGNYVLEVKDDVIILDTVIASDIKQTTFLPQVPKAGVINFHGDIRYRLTISGFNATKGAKAGDRKYSVEYDADNNGIIDNQDFLLLKPILSK